MEDVIPDKLGLTIELKYLIGFGAREVSGDVHFRALEQTKTLTTVKREEAS